MSLLLLIEGLGSIGIFSSRAFLPAFSTALLLRFLYPLKIVAPFRRYIPAWRNFPLRWVIRLVSPVRVVFQWVTRLGGLLLPGRMLIGYGAYRNALKKLAQFPSDPISHA